MTGIAVRLRTRVGAFDLDAAFETPGIGVTGLFGASGSGKTTLLRCIAGLRRAAAGAIELNGTVWQDEATGLFVPPHRRGVGYVSQEADLFPHLSVRNNLRYASRRVPGERHHFSWDEVVQWLAVGPLLDRTIANLSGGERQRVAIARALLASPHLLLMDEPVSALDEPARREVLSYLEQLLRRLALPVVYVSHSLGEVARLADHLVWLTQGRVGAAGPVSQVLGRLDFARWWGQESGVVLEGAVHQHDDEFQLTTVTTPLGEFTIHRRPEPPGAPLRLQVNARDVSLGLVPQTGSSILNELRVTVLEIADLTVSDCLVRLGQPQLHDTVLLAKITHKSRHQLGLEPGLALYARVKSVAVLD